jgi:dihydrofolate synthase / folylpolyglutamate synthase
VEIVSHHPLTVYDGAHNPAGAQALAESLDDVLGDRRPRVAVIGVLEDKDAAGMLAALLPRIDHAIFTRSQNPRSLSPATLASLAEKLGGPPWKTVSDPVAAVRDARSRAGPGGAVLATGSIYLVADLVRGETDVRASSL